MGVASLLSECSICSKLGEVETSFSKYGSNDPDILLPPEASRLTPIVPLDSYDIERHHVRRCPVCSTFYRYDQSYEYFVNGSEDEEELTRLTPTQAKEHLSETDYQNIIAFLESNRHASNPIDQHYIAKCLVSYYLTIGHVEGIEALLHDSRIDVVRGALFFLRWLLLHDYPPGILQPFRSTAIELSDASVDDIKYAGQCIVSYLSR